MRSAAMYRHCFISNYISIYLYNVVHISTETPQCQLYASYIFIVEIWSKVTLTLVWKYGILWLLTAMPEISTIFIVNTLHWFISDSISIYLYNVVLISMESTPCQLSAKFILIVEIWNKVTLMLVLKFDILCFLPAIMATSGYRPHILLYFSLWFNKILTLHAPGRP